MGIYNYITDLGIQIISFPTLEVCTHRLRLSYVDEEMNSLIICAIDSLGKESLLNLDKVCVYLLFCENFGREIHLSLIL